MPQSRLILIPQPLVSVFLIRYWYSYRSLISRLSKAKNLRFCDIFEGWGHFDSELLWTGMSYQKSWTAYEIAVKKSTSAEKYEPNISILWDSNGQLKKMAQNTCFYEGKIGPFWPIFAPSGHKVPRVPGPPPSKVMLILTLCNGKMGSHV